MTGDAPLGGEFWVSTRIVRHLLEWAARSGLPESELRAEAGLEDQALDDPLGRVDVACQYRLWAMCARRFPPGFAMMAGATMAVQALPSVGPLLAVSGTVRGALKHLVAGAPVMSNAMALSFVEADGFGGLQVDFHCPDHPIEAAESALAHWASLLASLRGTALSPAAVHLPFPYAGCDHSGFFSADVVYGAPRMRLLYREEDLSAPLAAPDVEAEAVLRELLARRRAMGEPRFSVRCRQAVLGIQPQADTSVEEVASRLGVSVRTMQRRLTEEDLTYRDVLDAVLEQEAKRRLGATGATIDETAWALGYRRRSFGRAFRRWTGMPPGAWQREHRSAFSIGS